MAAVIIGVLVELSLVLVASTAFPTVNVTQLFVDLSIVLVVGCWRRWALRRAAPRPGGRGGGGGRG